MPLYLLITHETSITVEIHLDIFWFVGLLSWKVDYRLIKCGGHLRYIGAADPGDKMGGVFGNFKVLICPVEVSWEH